MHLPRMASAARSQASTLGKPPSNNPLPNYLQQAAAVLGELAAVDPAEYERQQNATGEKAGVRSVAAFVKEMAAQLPRWVCSGSRLTRGSRMRPGGIRECAAALSAQVPVLAAYLTFTASHPPFRLHAPSSSLLLQPDGPPDCAAAAAPGRQGLRPAQRHRARHRLPAAQGVRRVRTGSGRMESAAVQGGTGEVHCWRSWAAGRQGHARLSRSVACRHRPRP